MHLRCGQIAAAATNADRVLMVRHWANRRTPKNPAAKGARQCIAVAAEVHVPLLCSVQNSFLWYVPFAEEREQGERVM